jgi:hypothetical protein
MPFPFNFRGCVCAITMNNKAASPQEEPRTSAELDVSHLINEQAKQLQPENISPCKFIIKFFKYSII